MTDAQHERVPAVGDAVIYVNDLGEASPATISSIWYRRRVDLEFAGAPRVTAVYYDPAGGPFTWHWPQCHPRESGDPGLDSRLRGNDGQGKEKE